MVFAGDIMQESQLAPLNTLGEEIASVLAKQPAASPQLDRHRSFMDVLLFHSGRTSDMESTRFHATFFPYHSETGYDYDTVFADFSFSAADADTKGRMGGAHCDYGIQRDKGAMLVVRPDQVVGWVGYFEDIVNMEKWLAGFTTATT